VLTGGAVDEAKVARLQAKALPKRLSAELRREFLLRYPFFWCHCGAPKKVGQGFVQDGGAFSVCWQEYPTILVPYCHEEFAYIVRQPIGGVLVTIYNGVAANQWFSGSAQPTLTSYHFRAVGCRESDVPGEGPFVVLEDIGATPSHLLSTPSQTSFQSVAAPAYNSGLLNPVANPNDAVGQLLNRNLGGDVALQYHFTESMRPVGAIYYRIQVARSDASGNPTGSWTPLPPMIWSTWKLNTAKPGSIALGPHTVGPESGLSMIPYDTGAPLGANEEWQDGQYHGVISTSGLADGRYLVMIEVFNAAGARLKPLAAPAAEAGVGAGFTFRRWNVPASTIAVPFAALTHMMWWDNRQAVADIVDIQLKRRGELGAVPVPRGWDRRQRRDPLPGLSSATRHALLPARPFADPDARPERALLAGREHARPRGRRGRPAATERFEDLGRPARRHASPAQEMRLRRESAGACQDDERRRHADQSQCRRDGGFRGRDRLKA